MERVRTQTKRIAVLGMMLAIIAALSALEHMLPPLPFLPPQVRPGLSNVVTMYTLFFLGTGPALLLTVLKSLFVLLMRGAVAGFLSLCGGLLSVGVILALAAVSKRRLSYLLLSVGGALAHNAGQLLAASLVLKTGLVFTYFPVLAVAGILMGSITGALLRAVMPLFDKTLGTAFDTEEARPGGKASEQ